MLGYLDNLTNLFSHEAQRCLRAGAQPLSRQTQHNSLREHTQVAGLSQSKPIRKHKKGNRRRIKESEIAKKPLLTFRLLLPRNTQRIIKRLCGTVLAIFVNPIINTVIGEIGGNIASCEGHWQRLT